MKLLVSRIAALKPDWVLVTNTISRLAQEFLLEAKIGFAIHVKHENLERVSRSTGADILESIADIIPNKTTLGTCAKCYIQNFVTNNGDKPIMIFDGCPPELGGTILLRGASKSILKRVKKLLLVK